MTRAQERRCKRALEAKRNELTREIGECRERLAIDPASDPMDQMRSVTDRDVAIRNVDRMCVILRLVERALGEIRNKTFGICARCGGDIPLKRLEAVPWSPYCVSCQERVEQSRGGTEPAIPATRYALAG